MNHLITRSHGGIGQLTKHYDCAVKLIQELSLGLKKHGTHLPEGSIGGSNMVPSVLNMCNSAGPSTNHTFSKERDFEELVKIVYVCV